MDKPDWIDLGAELRELAKAEGIAPLPFLELHDMAKRLYRAGWRKVAAPEVSECRICHKQAVCSQARCVECIGK